VRFLPASKWELRKGRTEDSSVCELILNTIYYVSLTVALFDSKNLGFFSPPAQRQRLIEQKAPVYYQKLDEMYHANADVKPDNFIYMAKQLTAEGVRQFTLVSSDEVFRLTSTSTIPPSFYEIINDSSPCKFYLVSIIIAL
jgi:hypothetical protein